MRAVTAQQNNILPMPSLDQRELTPGQERVWDQTWEATEYQRNPHRSYPGHYITRSMMRESPWNQRGLLLTYATQIYSVCIDQYAWISNQL